MLHAILKLHRNGSVEQFLNFFRAIFDMWSQNCKPRTFLLGSIATSWRIIFIINIFIEYRCLAAVYFCWPFMVLSSDYCSFFCIDLYCSASWRSNGYLSSHISQPVHLRWLRRSSRASRREIDSKQIAELSL